jgi:hypothetical protein
MDDWIKSFSLMIADVADAAFHAPLGALFGWATAGVLTIVIVSTLVSSGREMGRAILYIALGLIIYGEIVRPVSWMLWTG